MTTDIFERRARMESASQPTIAELDYAQQIGVDPTTLQDPKALDRLRRARLEDNIGNTGVSAAEFRWMLDNEPVVTGRLDFSN